MCYVIPSVLAIVQGVGEDRGCHNVTTSSIMEISKSNSSILEYFNETHLEPLDIQPRFSVSTYFWIMFTILLASACSYLALNVISFKNKKNSQAKEEPSVQAQFIPKTDETASKKTPFTDKELLEIRVLYVLSFVVTFIVFGLLPGLASYSTLPYGKI